MKKIFVPLLMLLSTAAMAAGKPDAAADLHRLFETTWQKELDADPQMANYLGDNRYNDRWTDMSKDAIAGRHQHDVDTLAALQAIPRADLSAADRLNYDLFEREYRQRLAVWRFKPHLYAINHQGGIQTLSEITELLQFNSVRDYENWIARLRAVGPLVDQHIALLDEAAREKRTQPRAIMQRIPLQLALQNVARAEDSPFYAPFLRFPD